MVTKPWTLAEAKPQLQDDIEVPIPPVVPEEREAPTVTEEVKEIPPTPLPVYTDEDIEGLLLKESQEQQVKNQAVALAAAVQQIQTELTEIRARLTELENQS